MMESLISLGAAAEAGDTPATVNHRTHNTILPLVHWCAKQHGAVCGAVEVGTTEPT